MESVHVSHCVKQTTESIRFRNSAQSCSGRFSIIITRCRDATEAGCMGRVMGRAGATNRNVLCDLEDVVESDRRRSSHFVRHISQLHLMLLLLLLLVVVVMLVSSGWQHAVVCRLQIEDVSWWRVRKGLRRSGACSVSTARRRRNCSAVHRHWRRIVLCRRHIVQVNNTPQVRCWTSTDSSGFRPRSRHHHISRVDTANSHVQTHRADTNRDRTVKSMPAASIGLQWQHHDSTFYSAWCRTWSFIDEVVLINFFTCFANSIFCMYRPKFTNFATTIVPRNVGVMQPLHLKGCAIYPLPSI